MKIVEKTEEKAIDKLLRAQAVRLNSTGAACQDFDADFANAYVERSLNATQQRLYESHMAVCAPCRKLTVSMMRAYLADSSPAQMATIASVEKSSSAWITWLRSLIPAFLTPRFALAATAIIAVALALPLFFSRPKEQSPGSIAQYNARPDSAREQTSSASAPASSAQQSAQQEVAAANEAPRKDQTGLVRGFGAAAPDEKSRENAKSLDHLLAAETKKDEAGEPAAPAPPPAADADDTAKKATEDAAQPKPAETTSSEEKARRGAPEPATGGAEKPLPKIDRREARALPDGDRSSQPTVTPLAPGRSGVELPAGKEKPVIRPGDSTPKSESRSDSVSRGSRIAEGPDSSDKRQYMSEGSVKPPVRSSREMKIAGKKFFLRDGIWTQEDFQKEKEMPVVPVEQGSELYNQLMAKHTRLKTYFTSLADQSAIIVYKGTVYKLTPKK